MAEAEDPELLDQFRHVVAAVVQMPVHICPDRSVQVFVMQFFGSFRSVYTRQIIVAAYKFHFPVNKSSGSEAQDRY